jgi:hypothetical protein
MVRTIAISFANTAVTILVISLILYLLKFRKLPIEIKVMGLFLTLNLLTEVISKSLFELGVNNLYLLHIYTFFEFLTWSLFYKYLLNSKSKIKNYYWPFVCFIAVLIILNSIFLEPVTGYNSNSKTLVQIIIIGYAIYYFFSNFGITDFSIPENQSVLWINFATMLYYSGSLFIVIFMKMLISNDSDTTSYNGFWLFNALLNVIFQLLILVSIWKVAFSKTRSLS